MAAGVPFAAAARRYLGADQGVQARATHRALMRRLAQAAREGGDARWPLLEQAAAGRVEPARRLPLLAMLADLESRAASAPAGSDPPQDWLEAGLARRLHRGGIATLEDLRRRIAQGGRWWLGLHAYGQVKARRLATHLERLLGDPPWRIEWPEAAERPQAAGAAERGAILRWAAADVPAGASRRTLEAERFRLWCAVERDRGLFAATAEDGRLYLAALADPPAGWRRSRPRDPLAPSCEFFVPAPTAARQRQARDLLCSLFGWLAAQRLIAHDPSRDLGESARAPAPAAPPRLPAAAWAAMATEIARRRPTPALRRLQWVCAFAEATGLSAGELLGARTGDLLPRDGGWLLAVHSAGGASRTFAVPSPAMQATRVYLAARGLALEALPPDAPLLGALDGASPVRYSAFCRTFGQLLRRALDAAAIEPAARDEIEEAGRRWLARPGAA